MMGYTEQDINNMISALDKAVDNSTGSDHDKHIMDAIDLLEGLLEEGRV